MATAMSFKLGAHEGMVRAGIFLVSQAIVFYSNLSLLFPKCLARKKYFVYVLGVIAAIGLSGLVMHVAELLFGFESPFIREIHEIHGHAVDYHPRIKHGKHGKHMREYAELLNRGHIIGHSIASFATLFLSTTIAFASSRQKREKEETELKNKKLTL